MRSTDMRSTDMATAIDSQPAGTDGEDPVPGRSSRVVAAMTRLASWRVWVLSAAVFLLFAGALFSSSAPFSIPAVEDACGQAPPDVRAFSSGGDVAEFLADCGTSGRTVYRNLQLADLAYPLVFGLFMASSLALVLRHLFPRRVSMVGIAALALAGTAFDYLENLCAWLALAFFPETVVTTELMGFASLAKHLSFWAAGGVLILGLPVLVARSLLRRVRGGGASSTVTGAMSQ